MPDNYSIQKKRQHGFTLLEVLIALLILSIGLLGLAALQTTGLRSNTMAIMRTQATQTAYDITDRMRANERAAGITRDPDNNRITYNSAEDAYLTANPVATVNCAEEGCTHQELALFDLVQWQDAVALLPGGKSKIECQDNAGGACADGEVLYPKNINHIITVYWDEARTGADGTNCPPLSKKDLRCFRLVYSE